MVENLADFYYSQLESNTQPGKLLLGMYKSVFDIESTNRSHIIMFNKLVKVYGRYNVFFAILAVAEMSNVDHTKNLYPLFSYMIKKRYEDRTSSANVESMESAEARIKQLEKKIRKLESVDLEIPEEEND